MTQNCLIAFPNRTDEGTLSGGSWQSTLPLTNLQSRILGKVARSSTAANANTTFKNTLTSAKKIDIVSLVNHNLSLDSTWRVRASNEGSATNLLTYTETIASWDVGTGTPILAPATFFGRDGVSVRTDIPSGDTPHKSVNYAGAAGTYSFSIYIDLSLSTAPTDLITFSGFSFDVGGGGYNFADSTFNPVTKVLTQGGTYRGASHVGHYAEQITSTIWRLTKVVNFAVDMVVFRIYVYTLTPLSRITVGLPQIEAGSHQTSYYQTVADVPGVRPAGYMDSWQSYLYDSGTITTWPSVYATTDLEWEYDNFWLGQYSSDEITGYTTAATHVVSTDTIAQYWRVDIYDTNNTSNYVQIGRLFMGPAWQPTYNAEVGLGMGWETNTQSQKALNGTKYYQRRTPYRVTTFNLQCMSVDEAMQNAFEIDRMAGIDKEVFYSFDPTDTLHALRRTYLGTLRELSAIEYPSPNLLKKGYAIEECV